MAQSRKSAVSRPKLVAENPDPTTGQLEQHEHLEHSGQAGQPEQSADAPTEPQSDTDDIEALWEDDELGDPLTTTHIHQIPIGKPKDFFWVCPDRKYRKKTWVYVHRSENVVGEQYFIVTKAMRAKVPLSRPCTLVTVVDRAGAPRIWPLWSPRPGENDNNAWITARSVAREALTNWVRIAYVSGRNESIAADKGYAPAPDSSKPPALNKMIRLAFGPEGIWHDEENRAYRSCFGKAAKEPDDLASDGEHDDDEDDPNVEDAVS